MMDVEREAEGDLLEDTGGVYQHQSSALFVCVCHFIPSFWNNSATVREGVTKFEMPRQKLLNKCMFLFIAPFDL